MREIKFRAWDGERKEMNHKVLVGNTCISDGNYTAHCIHNGTDWVNFDEYNDITLLQFTGLTDKNGVEIYEGDKLYLHHDDGEGNYADVVEWLADGDWLGWGLMIQGTPDELLVDNQEFLEVIGNIYENPELPEAGE